VTAILVAVALSNCGREGTPTGPSGPTSFLTGTWRGTVTIQVNPGDPNPPAPISGDMRWTFEVVPQTNMQSLRATIRSTHPWLTMETTGSTALSPGNSPPTQISTHGEFNSPRGCRGTFGSSQAILTAAKIFGPRRTNPHNIDYLFEVVRETRASAFSKEALERRKRHDSPNAEEWIRDYMKRVRILKATDVNRLHQLSRRHRRNV
jgi:hypothetical protein